MALGDWIAREQTFSELLKGRWPAGASLIQEMPTKPSTPGWRVALSMT